jgi:hypothetical protein
MNIGVEILTDKDGRKYLIDGIPPDVWNSFTETAKQLRSDVENPALAWAALLSDIIESIANTEKKSIILRDIPAGHIEAFALRCSQAGMDIPGLLTNMITSAEKNKFYLANYAVKREIDGKEKIVRGSNTIVLTGITEKAIKPFEVLFDKHSISIAQLFAQFFSQIEAGEIELTIVRKEGKVGEVATFTEAAETE